MILFFCFVQAGKHVVSIMIQHSSSMFVIQEMMVLLFVCPPDVAPGDVAPGDAGGKVDHQVFKINQVVRF